MNQSGIALRPRFPTSRRAYPTSFNLTLSHDMNTVLYCTLHASKVPTFGAFHRQKFICGKKSKGYSIAIRSLETCCRGQVRSALPLGRNVFHFFHPLLSPLTLPSSHETPQPLHAKCFRSVSYRASQHTDVCRCRQQDCASKIKWRYQIVQPEAQ